MVLFFYSLCVTHLVGLGFDFIMIVPIPSLSLDMVYLFPLAAAAAASKWLQSCLTLCDPIDGSPPGSPLPGILQARTLEWVEISFFSV